MFSFVKKLFSGRREAAPPRRNQPRASGDTEYRPLPRNRQPAAVDLLDNPDLSLTAPQDDGFDPYNTGTFNRSGSWERINKRRNS